MYKSNDSEEIAKLLSSFNYDESKKEEVLKKYYDLIKVADLHTHTNYSDGTNSPLVVLELAKKSNKNPAAVHLKVNQQFVPIQKHFLYESLAKAVSSLNQELTIFYRKSPRPIFEGKYKELIQFLY